MCDDALCRPKDTDHEIPRERCPPRVQIEFEAAIKTTDGAISATGRGTAYYWLNRDGTDFLSGTAITDLSKVDGTLSLSEPTAEGEHTGTLLVSFYFTREQTEGSLSAQVVTSKEHQAAQYFPLSGYWPPGSDEVEQPSAARIDEYAPDAQAED